MLYNPVTTCWNVLGDHEGKVGRETRLALVVERGECNGDWAKENSPARFCLQENLSLFVITEPASGADGKIKLSVSGI